MLKETASSIYATKRGYDYKEACDYLGVPPVFPRRVLDSRFESKRDDSDYKSEPKPPSWAEKAQLFVGWCHRQLLNSHQEIEYLKNRGISLAAIKKYWLGYNPSDLNRERVEWGLPEEINQKTEAPKKLWLPAGIVIPYWDNGQIVRVRIRRFKNDDYGRYIQIAGSDARPFIIPSKGNYSYCIVVEAELDAIMLHDQAGDFMNVIGLGTAGKKPCMKSKELLGRASKILVSLDANDEAGAKSFQKNWKYSQSKRWIYPGYKDPGDAVQDGKNIRDWVKAGLHPNVVDKPSPSPPPKPKPATKPKTVPNRVNCLSGYCTSARLVENEKISTLTCQINKHPVFDMYYDRIPCPIGQWARPQSKKMRQLIDLMIKIDNTKTIEEATRLTSEAEAIHEQLPKGEQDEIWRLSP